MSSPKYMTRAPVPMGQWLLDASVPTPSAVKATSAEYKQDDEDDQKCGAIHGSLLREIEPANLSAARRCCGDELNSSFQSPRPTFRRDPF
jgi:hypothetical protein